MRRYVYLETCEAQSIVLVVIAILRVTGYRSTRTHLVTVGCSIGDTVDSDYPDKNNDGSGGDLYRRHPNDPTDDDIDIDAIEPGPKVNRARYVDFAKMFQVILNIFF
jgi:hypothetical protein